MPTVRPYRADDQPQVAVVAAACGQVGPVTGSDPAYLPFLAGEGRVLLAEHGGRVVGYGAVRGHVAGVAYLADLFVHPSARGLGAGSALLDALWDGPAARVTSSSTDPRALTAYARRGARPRWPLLYLELEADGSTPVPTAAVDERPFAVGDAGFPMPVVSARTVSRPGAVAAVLDGADGPTVLRAETDDPVALRDLVRALAASGPGAGRVHLAVPAPHPALPLLLADGARVVDLDLWSADDAGLGLVDPSRTLPSPGLA